MYTFTKSRLGFTMVELLVAMAVMGALAAIIFPVLSEGRAKGRDAKRVADIEQLNVAIVLYREANSEEPCIGVSGSDLYIDDQTHCLAADLVPTYLPELQTDPTYGNDGAAAVGEDYEYDDGGGDGSYYVRAKLEGTSIARTSNHPDGSTCQSGSYSVCSWTGEDCVYASGADCSELWIHRSRP